MSNPRLSAWNQLFWRQYEPKRFDSDGKGRQRKPSSRHQHAEKASKKRQDSIELPHRSVQGQATGYGRITLQSLVFQLPFWGQHFKP